MREEGRVVRGVNREQSRDDQDENREAKQHAHRHLNPSEPAHTDDVNDIEQQQAAYREKLMIELAADAPPRELDDVIGQRPRQKSPGTDESENLQPRTTGTKAEPAQRARHC